MRRELIEALDYPLLQVLELIDQRDCPHSSLFEATSERCQHCELGRECHWVRCLNEFEDFEGKATHTINASLKYGIGLVETLHANLDHDTTTCECEPCVWISNSKRLHETFNERYALNPYRKML